MLVEESASAITLSGAAPVPSTISSSKTLSFLSPASKTHPVNERNPNISMMPSVLESRRLCFTTILLNKTIIRAYAVRRKGAFFAAPNLKTPQKTGLYVEHLETHRGF
jgi:hypothetical protein